eukprot:928647-Rhodomonas_salina.1
MSSTGHRRNQRQSRNRLVQTVLRTRGIAIDFAGQGVCLTRLEGPVHFDVSGPFFVQPLRNVHEKRMALFPA